MANFAKSFNVGDDGLAFGESQYAGIFADVVDPSTGVGQAAPIGSLFLYTGGTLFIKTGSTDTGWSPIENHTYAGLALYETSGNTLNVSTVNPSRITVSTTGVDLATTGIQGGTYTKLTVDQYGRAVIGGSLTSLDVTNALGFVPIPDNGALESLVTASQGIYVITGTGTAASRTILVSAGLSITNPNGVGGDISIGLSDNLLAVENINTTGLTTRNSAGAWTTVTLVPPPQGIAIANPDGTTGNPTFSLNSDLAAVEGLTTTGIAVRNAASSWITSSILGTANQINVANGDAIAGPPTISIADNVVLPGFGAVTIPAGNTANQPVGVVGALRYNTDLNVLSYFDADWQTIASQFWVSTNYQPLNLNLTALAATTGVGLYVVTGTGASAVRTITSPTGTIAIGNDNGVGGDITLDISPTYTGSTTITTAGTITTGTWNGAPISAYYGGTGLSTIGNANQILGVNSSGTALEYKDVVGGTSISVVPGVGSLTINNLGVTSIGAGTGVTVSGSTGNVSINNTGVLTVTQGAGTGAVNLTGDPQNVVVNGPQLYAESLDSPVPASTSTSVNAVAIGYASIAQADNSLAIGEQSLTRIHGGVVQANGRFASSGDAQTGRYVLRANTVSNFPSEGFMDGQGGNIRLVLPDNATWTFRIMVTAQRTDVNDGRAGFQLKGVIYRVAGAASVALQGGVTFEQFSSSDPWTVQVDADTGNGSLRVQFVGETGKVIRWVAMVETVEVTS